MLLSQPYDSKIDIWALGILLYEMVHGDAPYGENTPILEKMELIKNDKKIKYDNSLSPEILDLIKNLLKRDPEKRFSMTQLFDHPWMKEYEASYNIDILSFVSQNSVDANRKSFRSDNSFGSFKGSNSQSQRSIFSTMTSKPENNKKYYRRGPKTVKGGKGKFDLGSPDSECKLVISYFF